MRFVFLLSFLSSFLFSLSFQSQENKVTLLELYTSEGCSSCPSADTWLNKLQNNKELFKTFIPMAFHVDYWDFLGWKDSFAQNKFTKRQKNYSRNVWEKEAVYTPQFIIDSKEYKQWFYSKKFPKLTSVYAGKLFVRYANNKIEINYHNKTKNNKEEVFINIAILQNDLKTFVKAGENKNKHLEHDFVVKSLNTYPSKIEKGKLHYSNIFTINNTINKALVVFINNKKGEQIQAAAALF